MDTNQIETITRMVIESLNKAEEKPSKGFLVPVGVSARHVHLTQEHVEALFGPGYQLTRKKDLMGGQFASNEQVTIVGLKLRAIENVRILGPVRKQTQVDFRNGRKDARYKGADPSVRRYRWQRADRDCRAKRGHLSQ